MAFRCAGRHPVDAGADGARVILAGNRYLLPQERSSTTSCSPAAGACSNSRSVGGTFMTRTALGAVLARAGIAGEGQRLAYLMMDAELRAGRSAAGRAQGKQFTVRAARRACTDARGCSRTTRRWPSLTRRYFASHGPATVADFVWWSGLDREAGKDRPRDAWPGCRVTKRSTAPTVLVRARSGPSARKKPAGNGPLVHLLPNYDELMNALRDRRLFVDPAGSLPAGGFEGFPHQLAIDGILRGAWRINLDQPRGDD